MLRLNRWIAAVLAVCLLINTIPVHAFAETEESISTIETTVETTEETTVETTEETTVETTEETVEETTVETTEETTEETTGETTEETTVETTEETTQATTGETTGETIEETTEEITGETTEENTGVPITDPFALKFLALEIVDAENSEVMLFAETISKTVGDKYPNAITQDENGQITLTVNAGQEEILALLSAQTQTQDENYQDWIINFPSNTGTLTMPDGYKGLGDPDIPFRGKFTGQQFTIVSSTTVFKSLHTQADLNNAKISWNGPTDKPILADTLVSDDSPTSVDMPRASAANFSPYIGTLTGGSRSVILPELDYSQVKNDPNVAYQTDLGLACCVMDASTHLVIEKLTLPDGNKFTLKGIGNMGGLVGSMAENAELTISQSLELNATLQGTQDTSAQSVGGLVGSMTNASIIVSDGVNVTVSADVMLAQNAGGIAGEVTTETGPLDANANVRLQSVKANGMANSGVLYGTCTATGAFNPLADVSFGTTREVSGPGNCGGLFGTLTLKGSGKCTISGTDGAHLDISSTLSAANNTTQYGGIAGTLSGDARKNALVVDYCDITSTVNVGTESVNFPKYVGGILAVQGNGTTVDAGNSTVTLSKPRTPVNTYGIGGLCTSVGDGALLIADTMKVVIDSFVANQGSSGVAASTGKGAVVYLQNSLDLSDCLLETCANSGQIVGQQDCSLIYAPGVAITRLNTTSGTTSYSGVELDDIGNYGELYRIIPENPAKPFFEVDSNYDNVFNYSLAVSDTGACTLSSKEDYACLALAWQSRGAFPTVENWSSPSSITLKANIDLTGCGIGGLTRDVFSAEDTFSGTFNGDGHTLTLDIGAENQEKQTKVSKGDGRIYWHNATGLFAGLSSTATVQNLALSGSIRLSNNKLATMYSGALAAQVNGSWSEDSTLSKVSTSVKYEANVHGAKTLYLGGLIGQISGGTANIDLDTGTSLASTITISHSDNGSANHFGGAIGGIAGGASANITCSGATIGGSIVSTGSVNNFYAGGLIGTILPATGGSTRNIKLSNLAVNDFFLTCSAKDRMGGILGGIWADTDVTVDGLTVTNTTLTAKGAAALGGLVYRASGKWTVSSVDLSSLTISAGSASALGLLICHGEPYKDYINGSNQNMNGLYLEMAERWDWDAETKKGYNVPTSITFDSGVFDEFVAYTAYADRSSDTPNYQITANGSGIISLKTDNGTVNMGETDDRNTYVNRTAVGLGKQTNPYSRYYYNLDSIMAGFTDANDATVDTARELLIWSVCRYADSTLRKHFKIKGINELWKVNAIGSASSNPPADFDMDGLSYYPINITNESITVQNASVKFYNDAIEGKESGNKSTRGVDSNSQPPSHTQHYMMHASLFRDFKAENISETKDYTLTVNGVSFAGTVGVVNGGSGALLCGNVAGQALSGNTSICKVILADEDNVSRAVTLNGISVVPEGDYTPVLINKMDGYTTLEANYVTVDTQEQDSPAGSSLIGDIGGADANKVTVSFAGTIRLSEEGVFTKATLLNSLQYSDGSATYIFDYAKDDTAHDATHGKELSTSVEYEGKIGFYNDQDTTKVSPKKEGASDFSNYLPYVAFSPATKDDVHTLDKNWHELAVNIHSYNLMDGCGTYGHPYIVTAKEFREAASFVNSGKASNGWQIRMPTENAEYHSTNDGNDGVVIYRSGDTVTAKKIQEHLRSAYYKLVNDDNGKFELSNFNGIGSSPNTAFMGVIYSDGVTVKLTGGSSAFIKYSYGSVVRNVRFTLEQTPTLTWKNPGRMTSGTTPAQQAPGTFFGGVIGCVLGGDNILDGVNVSSSGFTLTLNGTNAYLIPVGGYVGVIAGGGVIFRGNCSGSVSLNTDYQDGSTCHIYNNPIIGRVLGGYAFYEGDETAPNNGNQDYKINTLSGDDHLSWDGSTVTVNSEQGLLILSAIVSSGAGSADSNAYSKGVARNAAYDAIGDPTKPADYATAKNEGKISYLSNYVSVTGEDNSIGKICTNDTNGITIQFAQGAGNVPMTFDMSTYGNGYRGLSARYVSNAAFKESTVNPYMVVLRVKTFDGQNAMVTGINMDVKEYANDDFHMASMGGIFNIVWTQKQSGGSGVGSNFAQNLTLANRKICLQYVDTKGAEQKQADTDTMVDEDGLSAVAVGGFIGSVSDVDVSTTPGKKTSNYLFSNIQIKGDSESDRCKITGPNSAGGLIGASAMTNSTLAGYPGKLLSNSKDTCFGPNFLNCSYENVDVTGTLAAGGLIGVAYASTSVPQFASMGTSSSSTTLYLTTCTVTIENSVLGQNSTISARGKNGVAGGLFGVAGMRVGVNYPSTGSDTGLSIEANQMYKFTLRSVTVKSSENDWELTRTDSKNPKNAPDNNYSNTAAGGIIGRISHVNQTYVYDVTMSGCTVDANTNVSNAYAAGIVAYGYTNTKMVASGCTLNQLSVNGKYAGGLVGYGWGGDGYNLHVSDCEISESKVNGDSYSGGLVGRAAGKYYITNVLIKNTSITGHKTNRGRLFGEMNDNTGKFYVYSAGVSVFVDKNGITTPALDGNTANYNGFIAYADYAGMQTNKAAGANPYVTVNPSFQLTADKAIYGDAVGKIPVDSSCDSVAERIWADNNDANVVGRKNLVSYGSAAGKAKPEVSTFHAIENVGPELPVLVLKGGDDSAIESYLNIITNGGYDKASKSTDANNTVELKEVAVYQYDVDNGSFRKIAPPTNQPASVYKDTSTGKYRVNNTSYDNTRKRFSLLEAEFTVKVNGETKTYTVSIPVMVIRKLQYNFMATLSYGREFDKDFFTHLRNHVLESTGNPFTAYLTYQYNCFYDTTQKKIVPSEYDWQSYLDGGGNMLNVDKELIFASNGSCNGLPSGTQLILLDCQNGNKAYQYTIKDGDTISDTRVQLSKFTSVSSGASFNASMADILNVTVTEKTDGKFVETTSDDSKATVCRNGKYYRPDTDSALTRYELTVPTLPDGYPEENYYLVVTVPHQMNSNNEPDTSFQINGNITSKLAWEMPSEGSQTHRYDGSGDKVGETDESTYLISTGYRQRLESGTSDAYINLGDGNQKMQVNVQDTITFSNGQAYGDSDKLFLKLTVNLQEYTNNGSESEEQQFPVGTKGTVKFYIQDAAQRTYYTWNGTEWESHTKSEESQKPQAAASYLWESKGSNMELLLSADGTTALDLSGMRQMIKGSLSKGDSQIIVTAEMEVEFGSSEVLNAAVPASDQNGTDTWAQLHYLGQISTQETSLSYSAMRATADDNAKYYRGVSYQAVLSMDAMHIDQLGVNPLQLVQDYQEIIAGKNASRIDLTAALNLSNLQDIESVLQNTNSITFTMSLQRKDDGYTNNVDNESTSKYIAFAWTDKLVPGWTWTIPKDQYYKDGTIVTNDIFDGTQFTFPITAYVFTDQKDFANYKIKLTVSFGENSSVSVTDSDANVVYTYACIKPSFYDPSESAGGNSTP